MIFNVYSQAYNQYRLGFIDKRSWEAWVTMIIELVNKPYARGHWEANKYQYNEPFRIFIDRLIKQAAQLDTGTNSSQIGGPFQVAQEAERE